jgi:hypothetical protein
MRGQDVLHVIDTVEKAAFVEIAESLREPAVF